MTTFNAITWNVENLFRPPLGAAGADSERYARRKIGLLARVIGKLSPGFVAGGRWRGVAT
jgi:hypothetical protein